MTSNSLKKGRYTQYSNKIGLYSNSKGGFIKNNSDVVLSFPFKDTLLEAGMSKEDVRKEERFLHLSLDSKDIDTLEEPKVLTNFKYIDEDGEKRLDKNNGLVFFDENGNLKHNLLIKGNNLLALYTLRQKIAGQVKLIYIDPPFNTGGDSFKYNDSFNHSSWLTFMKNRLEIAKDLLKDDGVIFVQCDDNEQAYLKVLMDEIFTPDNFINTIAIKSSTPSGLKTTHKENTIIRQKDTLHVYSRNKSLIKIKPNYYKSDKWDNHYCYFLDRENMRLHKLNTILKENNIYNTELDNKSFRNFYIKNAKNIYQTGKSMPEDIRKLSLKNENKDKVIPYGDNQFAYNGRRLSPLDSSLNYVWTKSGYSLEISKLVTDFWEDIDFNNTQNEGGVSFPAGKKPEYLLQRIIDMTTQENDIVLDYHLGSGTTSAVAHKMNRRWIGIEQMDYIEDVAKGRLKNVLSGEQGGISQSINWQGGGSFVYFELKKYNQEYIDLIQGAKSLKELESIYVDMRNNAFLKFWFDRGEFEKDENFRNLDLEKRKKVLIEILDENQLYLNYADMNDTRHNVSQDEKVLTNRFYGEN